MEGAVKGERRVHKVFIEDHTVLVRPDQQRLAFSDSMAKSAATDPFQHAVEEELAETDLVHLERVENRCELKTVLWDRSEKCEVHKTFHYRCEGYIDKTKRDGAARERGEVFGWDDYFVPLMLEQSFHELSVLGFKVSSRDMVLWMLPS